MANYRVQFLDRIGAVIREYIVEGLSLRGALDLFVEFEAPPESATLRVVDLSGRQIHIEWLGRRRRA